MDRLPYWRKQIGIWLASWKFFESTLKFDEFDCSFNFLANVLINVFHRRPKFSINCKISQHDFISSLF